METHYNENAPKVILEDKFFSYEDTVILAKHGALIENGNQFITIPNLCIYINATYELVFSEDEINDIIKSPKNSIAECCRFNRFYTCRNLDCG